MADYVVGDIQGCYDSLRKLLDHIQFSWNKDRLWLAGDLINRGPESLKVLNYLYNKRHHVHLVLGNHDLHFLAVHAGVTEPRPKDTLQPILNAANCQKLVRWLRQQPLAIDIKKHKAFLSHAGVYPLWSRKDALQRAAEVEACLRSSTRKKFFKSMYGDEPAIWKDDLAGMPRLRFITNCFTRMRYLREDFSLDLSCKLPPGQQDASLIPWFEFNLKPWSRDRLFGHWAALNGTVNRDGLYALDTGCVWGGQLSALRLDDRALFSVPAAEKITKRDE